MEIELADAVAVVRDELLEAAKRGVGADIEFAVGPVELEFAVELKKDVKAKAGFKAWVVTGEASGGVAHARTHRIKVTLTPKGKDGGDFLVSADSDGSEESTDLPGHIGR